MLESGILKSFCDLQIVMLGVQNAWAKCREASGLCHAIGDARHHCCSAAAFLVDFEQDSDWKACEVYDLLSDVDRMVAHEAYISVISLGQMMRSGLEDNMPGAEEIELALASIGHLLDALGPFASPADHALRKVAIDREPIERFLEDCNRRTRRLDEIESSGQWTMELHERADPFTSLAGLLVEPHDTEAFELVDFSGDSSDALGVDVNHDSRDVDLSNPDELAACVVSERDVDVSSPTEREGRDDFNGQWTREFPRGTHDALVECCDVDVRSQRIRGTHDALVEGRDVDVRSQRIRGTHDALVESCDVAASGHWTLELPAGTDALDARAEMSGTTPNSFESRRAS